MLGGSFIPNSNWKPIFISHGSPASDMSNPGLLAESVSRVEFARNVSLTCRAQKTRRRGIVFKLFSANCNYAYLIMPNAAHTRASNFIRVPNEPTLDFLLSLERYGSLQIGREVQFQRVYVPDSSWWRYIFIVVVTLSPLTFERSHPSIVSFMSPTLAFVLIWTVVTS